MSGGPPRRCNYPAGIWARVIRRRLSSRETCRFPICCRPKSSDRKQRDREMQALFELDKQFRADYAMESEIAGAHAERSNWPPA